MAAQITTSRMIGLGGTEHVANHEAMQNVVNAAADGILITPATAGTIASWWQSPGGIGSVLAGFASGAAVKRAELLDDIHATRQADKPTGDDVTALEMLAKFVSEYYLRDEDTAEFHAARDDWERERLDNVRQLIRNGDAGPMITARLPFANKTGSFRGRVFYGLEKVSLTDAGIDCYHRHGYGTLPIGQMSNETVAMVVADLDEISSYNGNAYVVTSYDTVIGWTRGMKHNGTLYVPEIFYSTTTTKHQRITAHPER